MRRVVITGLGVVSPVGNTVEEAWASVIAGKSGIDVIPKWRDYRSQDGRCLDVWIGGSVTHFDPVQAVKVKKDIRRMDRFIQFALEASSQAWQQAGFAEHLDDGIAPRYGAVIGVGLMGMDAFLNAYDVMITRGPDRVTPFFIPSTIANLAAGQVAIRFNLQNANYAVASACASGNHAIGEAFLRIRSGLADVMLAGGAESAMHPLAVSGFQSLQALSRHHNDRPKEASRPFDRDRDGFVMAEGAGILVLEELEHAKKRDAVILAELIGYGATCDAYHMTAPHTNGRGAQQAMQQALDVARIVPEQVNYINAHGTSTVYNDRLETLAIKNVFAQHANRLLISSTKSMTGHLLGAAGGLEAVFSVMALRDKIAPPTINLLNSDPECDLDYVANTARMTKINVVMSNAFGFGGTNAILLFASL